MNRTLVALTVAYVMGIFLVKLIQLNFWLALILEAVFLFASFIFRSKNQPSVIFILLSVLFLGSLSLINSNLVPKNHINNFVYYRNNFLYSLDGFVDTDPVVKNNSVWFIFCIRQAQVGKFRWGSVGRILVKTDFLLELNYGDSLKLVGNLGRQYGSDNLIMRIKEARQVINYHKNSGSKLIRGSIWLRSKIEAVIRRHLIPLAAGIVSAMVLGQKQGVPWLINDYMIKSGTVHILVVSGFNVGIVAFIINLLFKMMRIKRKARIILVIISLLVYCLVTGSTNPVVRATIMGITFLLTYYFKRSADIYNALALSALLILVINPVQLFEVSFQLSFMSVLAIVYFYPKLNVFFRLDNCRIKLWKFICQGCLVSFSAWLGTLGIIALNFGTISTITVLANILIVPLATLITLCGFLLVLTGFIFPGLAHLFSAPASLLVNLLLSTNILLAKLPFAYFCLANSAEFR